MALPRRLTGDGKLFMLEVHGDSMIEAAICDGDWVVVRSQPDASNGDIVAAMLEDVDGASATVKVLSRRDGHQWLLPATLTTPRSRRRGHDYGQGRHRPARALAQPAKPAA